MKNYTSPRYDQKREQVPHFPDLLSGIVLPPEEDTHTGYIFKAGVYQGRVQDGEFTPAADAPCPPDLEQAARNLHERF